MRKSHARVHLKSSAAPRHFRDEVLFISLPGSVGKLQCGVFQVNCSEGEFCKVLLYFLNI